MRASGWLVWGVLSNSALVWAQPPQTYAIVVGIDEYVRPSIPKLRYAVADAKLFAQALQDVVRVPADHVVLMTSDTVDENRQPRLVNVAYQLGWLKERLRPQDTLVFYFAGHGVTLGGDPYLLTEEADNRSPLTLKVSALHGGSLLASLREIQIGNVWVVLDACRNNPSSKSEPTTLDSAVTNTFSNVDVGRLQTATMMSCKVGERSWEWDEKRHGCYTWFLVNGLREQAADASGRVTLETLYRYVRDQVPPVARKFGAAQNPTMFYGGPGVDRWTLAQLTNRVGAGGAEPQAREYVARLEMLQAQLDRETALRVAAEQRARLAEGQKRELEQRLSLLEQQLAGPTSPRLPEVRPDALAYNRGLGEAHAQALEAEVERLKKENGALKQRLTQVERQIASAGLSSREVRLESDPAAKQRWKDSEARQYQAEALLVSSHDMQLCLDSCLTVRHCQQEQLEILECAYASDLKAQWARRMSPDDPRSQQFAREFAATQNQIQQLRELNQMNRLRLQAAERARDEAQSRWAEAQLRIKACEAEIRGLKSELEECRERLTEVGRELSLAEQERDRALRELKQLDDQDRRLRDPSQNRNGDIYGVSRPGKREYLWRIIEVPPEATELPQRQSK